MADVYRKKLDAFLAKKPETFVLRLLREARVGTVLHRAALERSREFEAEEPAAE